VAAVFIAKLYITGLSDINVVAILAAYNCFYANVYAFSDRSVDTEKTGAGGCFEGVKASNFLQCQ